MRGARRDYEVLQRRRGQEANPPVPRQWILRRRQSPCGSITCRCADVTHPPRVSNEMIERFGEWMRQRPTPQSPIPRMPGSSARADSPPDPPSPLSPWVLGEAGLRINATENEYMEWVQELRERIRNQDATVAQRRIWCFFQKVTEAEARLVEPIPIPEELTQEYAKALPRQELMKPELTDEEYAKMLHGMELIAKFEEEEKENEEEEWERALLNCRVCGRYFVCGSGGVMISPGGSRRHGQGLCWECRDRKRKKSTKHKKLTHKMFDKLQNEDIVDKLEDDEDILDKLEEEK